MSKLSPETPAPKRGGKRERLIRVLTEGPVDKALKQRAEWMIEELKVGRYLAPKITYKDPGALKVNNIKQGVTVLSIGAGKGHEIDEMDMILPGSRIIGMDPDDYMARPVANRLKSLAHNPSYLGTQNRAEDMQDIADSSADGVTLNFVLHHIEEQAHDRVLAEVKRVLKDDGYLFIAEDLVDSEVEKKLVEREDRKINMEITANAPHSYKSVKEWEEYFQERGLEIVEHHEVKPGKVRHGFFVLQKTQNK